MRSKHSLKNHLAVIPVSPSGDSGGVSWLWAVTQTAEQECESLRQGGGSSWLVPGWPGVGKRP